MSKNTTSNRSTSGGTATPPRRPGGIFHRYREPVTITYNASTELYSVRLGRKYVAWEIYYEAALALQDLISANPAYADEVIEMRATRIVVTRKPRS